MCCVSVGMCVLPFVCMYTIPCRLFIDPVFAYKQFDFFRTSVFCVSQFSNKCVKCSWKRQCCWIEKNYTLYAKSLLFYNNTQQNEETLYPWSELVNFYIICGSHWNKIYLTIQTFCWKWNKRNKKKFPWKWNISEQKVHGKLWI